MGNYVFSLLCLKDGITFKFVNLIEKFFLGCFFEGENFWEKFLLAGIEFIKDCECMFWKID